MDKDDEDSKRRTNWSEDRTLMANERTYSSWMGTGLGAIGVAIGMKAVFGAFEPTWAAKAVASMFLLIAIVIFWSARNQACKTRQRLHDTDADPLSTHGFTRLATIMTIATVGTGAILWGL